MFPRQVLKRPSSRRHHLLIIGLSFILATGYAQWPTSYEDPLIIGGGTNVRAGNVSATPEGDVIVVFDNIKSGIRRLDAARYNPAGDQLYPETAFYNASHATVWVKLLRAPSPDYVFTLVSRLAKSYPGNLDETWLLQVIEPDMTWASTSAGSARLAFDSVNIVNGSYAEFTEFPWQNQFAIKTINLPNTAYIDLEPDEHIGEAKLHVFTNNNVVGVFTRVGRQPDTPGKVWAISLLPNVVPHILLAPREVAPMPGANQSNPQIVRLDQNNAMLTWLSELDGKVDLYASAVNSFASESSPPRKCFSNVVDYVTTGSSLGLPVFAAVQRESEFPLVETLVGGLINPSNGGTLTIPITSVPGVKVKALRQEANGDFSLVYSIPENGTNLLKVRRISGVTAGTIWETTVADLGLVSDEILKRHPNTWVTGNPDNVLYILARYDEPNTANSSFQLVRLRADGTLGAD